MLKIANTSETQLQHWNVTQPRLPIATKAPAELVKPGLIEGFHPSICRNLIFHDVLEALEKSDRPSFTEGPSPFRIQTRKSLCSYVGIPE